MRPILTPESDMRAMVLRNKKLSIEEVPTPAPGPMQVVAKVRACGICGSDLHAAKYLEQMIEATRAAGRSAWSTLDLERPIVMGHEYCVEVVQAGAGAEDWTPGTRATSVPALLAPGSPSGTLGLGYAAEAPGAYAEYILLSAPLLLRVPDSVPDEVAATTEPLAVGLHAVRAAKVAVGEAAVIMGAGPIGLMTLLWLKYDGVARVVVSDPAPDRRALAGRLGADVVIDPSAGSGADAILNAAGGQPPVVFECVGVEGTLEQAMELAGRGGRVIVVGVCMNPDTIRPMVGINKQLVLQFVLGYTPQEYAEALAALADGKIDTSPMISRTVTLDELPDAFTALASPKDCKIVLKF